MNLQQETIAIMKKHNIYANKSLGQNFLINNEVIEEIIQSAKVCKDDLIIEIGPGLGTLTKPLIEKAGKVVCIEIDPKMIKILDERFKENSNFELINSDVLKIDINKIIKKEKSENGFKSAKIVANLPYYITTPIIMKLLEEKLEIESITVMIQKEVAKRLAAKPGEKLSGAITYSVYYYAETEEKLIVSPKSFIPNPSVESEVIKLNLRKNPLINLENEKKVFKIIKQAFMKRRKTLVNALANTEFFEKKEEIEDVLSKLNIDKKVRGENLTLEEYAKISKYSK